jgi:hypothetical protein
MKINILGFKTIEIALIGIMSLCGTIAFDSSHLFSTPSYFALIIWGVLFVIGVLMVALAGKKLGIFTWLVILFSSPATLSFNSLDLPRLIKLGVINQVFKSDLSFSQILILGIIIITCYLLLYFILTINKTRVSLKKRGANSNETDKVFEKSYLVLLFFAGIAIFIAMLILAFTKGIELISTPMIKSISPSILLVGMICTILIALYLYWLVSSRKRIP